MVNDLHLVDLAVTFDARDAARNVNGVVEVNVIGGLVNFDPRNRIPRSIALAHGGEQGAVGLDLVMAVHAGLSGRHIGVTRLLDVAMAVTTIHAELTGVERVAERNGLHRGVADARILRRRVVSDAGRHDAGGESDEDQDLKRQFVNRLREKLGHDERGGSGGGLEGAELRCTLGACDRLGIRLDGERGLGGEGRIWINRRGR